MKTIKSIVVSFVMMCILALFIPLSEYSFHVYLSDIIIIVIPVTILILYTVQKVFNIESKTQAFVSVIISSVCAVGLGIARNTVFITAYHFKLKEQDNISLITRLKALDFTYFQMGLDEFLLIILPFVITIVVLIYIENRSINVLKSRLYCGLMILLIFLVTVIGLGYIIYIYPFVGTMFIIVPLYLMLKIIHFHIKVNYLVSTLIIGLIIPFSIVFISLTIHNYFITMRFQFNRVYDIMFLSQFSTGYIIGIVLVAIIGITYKFFNQDLVEEV